MKRKYRSLDENYHHVKTDNQRLESEATKQQRRIDQLLNLSEGAKNIGISSEIRRDIEKSILVRQLKNQINHLRNDLADKDAEVDTLKRNMKSTHIAELVNERDEYFLEVQRLKAALIEVREELQRERQRREWNTRVAGDASEDLRREVARLSSGYQSMLANISNRNTAVNGVRPSTTSGTRPSSEFTPTVSTNRPVSAAAATSGGSGSPHKELHSERPKRPLSATSKHTPLSSYFQADTASIVPGTVVSNPQALLTTADPLDNFGVPGAILGSTTGTVNSLLTPELQNFINDTAPANSSAPVDDSGIFKIGDRVQGQFQGGPHWYNGEIKGHNSHDGTYSVQYDDGDHEPAVPLAQLRAFAAAEVIPVQTTPLMVPTLAAAPASHPALIGGGPGYSPAAAAAARPKPTLLPITAAPYKVGDKIEALYYKGTTWYSGKIQAVQPVPNTGDGDFVYDISYDDGDRELKVPFSNIRKKESPQQPKSSPSADASSTAAAPPSPTKANKTTSQQRSSPRTTTEPKKEPEVIEKPLPKFKVGEVVEGLFDGGPDWYAGKITKVNISSTGNTSPTYGIDYDDGDRETAVLEGNIRSIVASTPSPTKPTPTATKAAGPYKAGDRVQGYFEDMAAWYDGTVRTVNADGTCYIDYDDGDEEAAKSIHKMRLPASATQHSHEPAVSSSSPPKPSQSSTIASPTVPLPTTEVVEPVSKFKVNDRVEGKFDNGDEWYPAVITKIRNPGPFALYALDYDDGDVEEAVEERSIRLMAIDPMPPISSIPTPTTATAPIITKPTTTSPIRKTSIVNTNLDSFLDELSDDDDESATGPGGLDSGRGMTLRPQVEVEDPVITKAVSEEAEDEGYDEDFDA